MEYDKRGMSPWLIGLFDKMDEPLLKSILYARNLPKPPCVIYRILNQENKLCYIGQSRTVKRRMSTHFNELKHNKHRNKKMQADYNKYGSKVFSAEIVMGELYDDEVGEFEFAWMLYYNSVQEGYNIANSSKKHVKEALLVVQNLAEYKENFPEDCPTQFIPIRI